MKTRLGSATKASVIAAAAVIGFLAGTNHSQGQTPGRGPGQRPFENTYRRPVVSPYMQLEQQGLNPMQSQNIYQRQVQPQLEQQRQQIEMLQQRREIGKMQNQVQRIQQGTQGRQIDSTIRATGHASTYMNYSHYYPMGR